MNLTQAKKVKGKAALLEAIKQCTKLAAAHHPDRNPGDKGAAKRFQDLMTVRDYLKKRLPHGCAVCGEPIGRTATHCRLHQRKKALPPANCGTSAVEATTKANSNARVSVTTDPLAPLGFYHAKIQKIAKKWNDKIGARWVEHVFFAVAKAARYGDPLHLDTPTTAHLPAAFEMGTAICKILSDTNKPAYWLLKLPDVYVSNNNQFLGWPGIAEKIVAYGGPTFKASSLTKAAERLQLIPPESIAREWRSVMTKAR